MHVASVKKLFSPSVYLSDNLKKQVVFIHYPNSVKTIALGCIAT